MTTILHKRKHGAISNGELGEAEWGMDVDTGTWYYSVDGITVLTLSLDPTGVGLPNVTNDAQLKIASNLSDLNNVATARSNLGLGTAATKNTGTADGEVPLLGTGGKLNSGVLPSIAITDVFVVASQAAMLALTAERGDVAVRSDLNKSFILSTESPGTLADWKELLTPTDAVLSVAGRTGVVVLVKADVGLSNVDNTSDATKNAATATLANKTLTAPVINSPSGLVKGDVGLGNVDNTSDANKPVSTAQQTALDGKVDENAAITGATKTKITYDAKGLVTGGADATTADIADSTDKRYVTDAQRTVIQNTSGTNTGDQTSVTGNAGTATALQTSRNIDGQAFNGTANITVVAPATHAATSKTTPVDDDEIPVADSAASFILKKLTWANIKATLKAYFDTLYQVLNANLTIIAGLTPTTDNFIQSKAGAWASRTVAQVKSDLGLSGTNSGDQTSIVGITGTTAQFNTANTDGDFATLAGTETLTNKSLTSPILNSPVVGAGTVGPRTSLTDPNNVPGYSQIYFYPASGTNTGESFSVMPRGTGYSATNKAQFNLFNTDPVADASNYEWAGFRSIGTGGFVFGTGKVGTGSNRALMLAAGWFSDGVTNDGQLYLATDGKVGVGTSSPAELLHVNGIAKINGCRFMGQTSSAGLPTTTQFPSAGDYGFHKDTSTGKRYHAWNEGGTVVKVEMA